MHFSLLLTTRGTWLAVSNFCCCGSDMWQPRTVSWVLSPAHCSNVEVFTPWSGTETLPIFLLPGLDRLLDLQKREREEQNGKPRLSKEMSSKYAPASHRNFINESVVFCNHLLIFLILCMYVSLVMSMLRSSCGDQSIAFEGEFLPLLCWDWVTLVVSVAAPMSCKACWACRCTPLHPAFYRGTQDLCAQAYMASKRFDPVSRLSVLGTS